MYTDKIIIFTLIIFKRIFTLCILYQKKNNDTVLYTLYIYVYNIMIENVMKKVHQNHIKYIII